MKSKLLVVGINPSHKKKKNPTLDRLHSWMKQLGVSYFSFTNIIHTEGNYLKSQIDYEFVEELCQGYDKIICLGNFVSAAMTRINIPHHTMPHPSPLNRNLNCKIYEKDQLTLAMDYLND